MSLPFFYVATLAGGTQVLNEETSKHVTGVLRMKAGEPLLLTDGRGTRAHALITDDNRKRCAVQVTGTETVPVRKPGVTIGISLVKNSARFEWFLEKATEIGVTEIIPLLCERTEKEKFRHDRLSAILVSAMLQSQQCWLPVLHQPVPCAEILATAAAPHRFIAHCLPQQKQSLSAFSGNLTGDRLLLVGPEGDFTEKEVAAALQHGFQPVILGDTRLRTETAGMVAATLLCIGM